MVDRFVVFGWSLLYRNIFEWGLYKGGENENTEARHVSDSYNLSYFDSSRRKNRKSRTAIVISSSYRNLPHTPLIAAGDVGIME